MNNKSRWPCPACVSFALAQNWINDRPQGDEGKKFPQGSAIDSSVVFLIVGLEMLWVKGLKKRK